MRSLFCLSLLVLTYAGRADESVLGSAFEPETNLKISVLQQDQPGAKPRLLLKVGPDASASRVALSVSGLQDDQALRKEEPLMAANVRMSSGAAMIVSFTLIDGRGHVRCVCAILVQDKAGHWAVSKEWLADCAPLGEMGFIRQKQTLSALKEGTVTRRVQDTTVEGVAYTLDCGCPACASRTTDFQIDETYTFNPASGTFERSAFEKRYVVQPGEGLMAVARKALGDARMLARLYKLNPDIKPESMLKEGQKVVVEREGK